MFCRRRAEICCQGDFQPNWIMENFLHFLELANEGKRKMGRPPKIAPYSHYDEYKPSDVEFFISLIVGRENLYNPCDEFNEDRQKAFYFIEKKCSHFLAMRKGRNAEKLWLNLFTNFEKEYRNRTRTSSSSEQLSTETTSTPFPFYRYMEFLIPYIERFENQQNTTVNTNALFLNLQSNLTDEEVNIKRPRIDTAAQEEWFLKVLETVAETQKSKIVPIREPSPPPIPTRSIDQQIVKEEVPIPEKYADIITWITSYLDLVPNDKMMLSKVRLFQFIESEKQKIKDNIPMTL
ncbi:unnamed protein product [Caenorhabditis angaria]|uniref:Uncharacterized protein n=1 Tax=Caenorhabditis angaria TaxID=860376 RepID=A0A9P1ICH5_9PELO|nr:unnamed protein product [Caenorhabditis angaria]